VPGRFGLFTDENIPGPLITALIARGWDVVRAVDVFGERTDDEVLFAYAAEQERVFVTDDRPAVAVAIRWLQAGRGFHGMIRCPAREMSVGDLVEAFDTLAALEAPFGGYPIIHFKRRG
jgi:hypothetical protein